MATTGELKQEPAILQFREWDVQVFISSYSANHAPAILIRAADTQRNLDNDTYPGEPIATASVCIPSEKIGPRQTFIKDWSENYGMLEWLTENGIVNETGVGVVCGFELAELTSLRPDAPVCWDDSSRGH